LRSVISAKQVTTPASVVRSELKRGWELTLSQVKVRSGRDCLAR
jgi:hypothetical protein